MSRLPALLVLLLTPGCFWFTTKHEGHTLRTEVDDLKVRVSKQEETYGSKVLKLDQSLEKATRVLQTSSADLGAEVQKLSGELASLVGKLESLRRDLEALRTDNDRLRSDLTTTVARLDTLEKGRPAGGAAAESPAPAPAAIDKEELFKNAQDKLKAGQYEDARRDFRQYVQRFPRDEKADNAQYGVGEAFYKERAYEKAIQEFQRVIDSYSTGDMVDDSFYAAGLAASEMRWCTDARAYLGVLVQKYPQSPHSKPAKAKLELLKKNAKKPTVCQS